jgi:hypothetical protein
VTAGVLDLLRPHDGGAWDRGEPAGEDEVAAAEGAIGRPLPADWRDVLAAGGGGVYGENAGVLFFSARDVLRLNPPGLHAPRLAGMILFADDEGDFFYYFDPEGRLRRGAWAVFLVEKSVMRPEHSRFVGRHLCHLLERILAGHDLTAAPFLEDEHG